MTFTREVSVLAVRADLGDLHARTLAGGLPHFLLHVADCSLGALGAVELRDGVVDARLHGDHRDHATTRGGTDLLGGDEVQRVAHGEVELVAARADRDHVVALGEVLGHELGHRRVDLGGGEVDVVDAELHGERVDHLALGDDAGLHQLVAETTFGLLLVCQRLAELLLCDYACVNEQIAESGELHVWLRSNLQQCHLWYYD